jgi:hypothetical protein
MQDISTRRGQAMKREHDRTVAGNLAVQRQARTVDREDT